VSRLILDTSALVAYAAGSIDVGEPVAEVHSEGGRVMIPVACLIEAAQQVDDEMLNILLAHPACDVALPTVETWTMVADAYRVLGRADLAAALISATLVNGYVLTGEPDAYSPLGDDIVIGF
jgi:hypothetical protein